MNIENQKHSTASFKCLGCGFQHDFNLYVLKKIAIDYLGLNEEEAKQLTEYDVITSNYCHKCITEANFPKIQLTIQKNARLPK